jgi:uncharacterized protein (DUF433 family)
MSINPTIERTPGICGGRARIAGTRVPVHRVTGYYRLGYAPEEILDLLNSLSLAQVHAALAYSLANVEEVEQSLREEEESLAQLVPPEVRLA